MLNHAAGLLVYIFIKLFTRSNQGAQTEEINGWMKVTEGFFFETDLPSGTFCYSLISPQERSLLAFLILKWKIKYSVFFICLWKCIEWRLSGQNAIFNKKAKISKRHLGLTVYCIYRVINHFALLMWHFCHIACHRTMEACDQDGLYLSFATLLPSEFCKVAQLGVSLHRSY